MKAHNLYKRSLQMHRSFQPSACVRIRCTAVLCDGIMLTESAIRCDLMCRDMCLQGHGAAVQKVPDLSNDYTDALSETDDAQTQISLHSATAAENSRSVTVAEPLRPTSVAEARVQVAQKLIHDSNMKRSLRMTRGASAAALLKQRTSTKLTR